MGIMKLFAGKKEKENIENKAQKAAIADATEIKQANELAYKYLQDWLAQKDSDLELAMRQLIKSIYCNITYEDNTFRFSEDDRIPDDEMVAPVQGQFLKENKELFNEEMVEECLNVPVANPPSLDRIRAVLYPYINE